jgi:acyl-CoA oxidase
MRGIAIAEGDMLGISIRASFPHISISISHSFPTATIGLTSELLLGRYEFEPPRYPDSLLAQHERGIFSELRASLAIAPSHRSAAYDQEILPRSLSFIQAIGHRLSYDAARATAIDTPLLDLFEIASVLQDEAWYVECLGMTRSELRQREACALEVVYPHLEEYLARMDVAPYIFAPISSDERWRMFVDTLQTFGATGSELGAGTLEALLYDDDSSMQVQMAAPHRSVRSRL